MASLQSSFIVILVIFIVLLFSMIAFTEEIKEIFIGASDKTSCKTSVKSNSKLCLKGITDVEIECPSRTLNIRQKNENQIKPILAKSLYDCWDQFDQGRSQLCGGDGIYCSVCDYMPFENNDVVINDFSTYLATNNIPAGNMKYFEYLSSDKSLGSEFLEYKQSEGISDILDTSVEDKYATVFVQIKGKNQIDNYLKKAKYSTPGIGIMAVGFLTIKAGLATTGATWWTGVGGAAGLTTTAAGGLILLGGGLYTGIASYLVEEPFDHISYVYLGPYDADALRELGCQNLPSQQS